MSEQAKQERLLPEEKPRPAGVGRWSRIDPVIMPAENEIALRLELSEGPLRSFVLCMRDGQADEVVVAIRAAQLDLALHRRERRRQDEDGAGDAACT